MLYRVSYWNFMEKQIESTSTNRIQSLKERVALDLEKKLTEYRDRKVGVRLLAQKIDVNERTISRLLRRENRPTYQTLLKIYGVIFNTTNNAQIVSLVPEIISEEIKKHCPEVESLKSATMPAIESELLYDKCFAEIYIMAGCGPLSIEFVQYRYGINGVETLEKMVELKALKISKDGQYILGENVVNFSPELLKRVGNNISEKFCKPNNSEVGGENLIAFYADGLSDEAYNEWLKVDERAYREKINISKQDGAKGNKRVFTYMVTDTFMDK